uniref:Rad60/SUMO-like domain-containing protein n=1 Tax=Sparus aurata TaxID=8175 RepID=A0A671W2N8_SPAAU
IKVFCYLSRMSSRAQGTVRFHFDGCKVTHSQTPAQLDMEDGDIIESCSAQTETGLYF